MFLDFFNVNIKKIKIILNFFFVTALLFYFYTNDTFSILINDLNYTIFFVIIFFEIIKILITVQINYKLYQQLIKITFDKLILINTLNSLSNFLITTTGTILNSLILKSRYQLEIKNFIFLKFFYATTGCLIYSLIGLIFSVFFPKVITIFFAILFFVTILLNFAPIETFYIYRKITILKKINLLRKKISKVFYINFFFFSIHFLFSVLIYYILFYNFNIKVNFVSIIVFTSIIISASFLSLNIFGFGLGDLLALFFFHVNGANTEVILLILFISKIFFIIANFLIYVQQIIVRKKL